MKIIYYKKNTRVIAALSAALLLILCLVIYAIFSYVVKSNPSLDSGVTIDKAPVKGNTFTKKVLTFASFNFVRTDNSATVVRAFITEKGFAAIPLEFFNNLKEIVWKENGREIVIDSGAYWQPGAPFLLLKVPYENQDDPYEITKFDPIKPLLWKRDNSEISETFIAPTVTVPSENYYVEIGFTQHNASGLFIQGKRVVGWTFSLFKNKGYLWGGMSEQNLIPNIELSVLNVLLNGEPQVKIKESSMGNDVTFMMIKNLSSFFTESRPSRAWDPIITSILNRVCSNGIAERRYHEVVSIITPVLLLKSQDIVLLSCYAKANEDIYGYELAISMLEKLKKERNITAVFSNSIALLIVKSYIQWVQELLFHKKYDDAISTYNSAITQYPAEQDLRICGIETYIKLNNWQRAGEILSSTKFDSKYFPILQKLKNIIDAMKASENKIIINFPPNDQRNIFVDGIVNEEISQRFILDTGASMVSIPLATANRLGMDVLNSSYTTRTIATASGIFQTKEIVLRSITINGKTIYNIPAIVIDLPQDTNVGLLGMNFLSRFHMELNNEKGEIILTPKE